MDRSGLILDIFDLRAQSREARTQVELARLKYMLPRLTRQWSHLSRQGGGVGTRGGEGESQLEQDRRVICASASAGSRRIWRRSSAPAASSGTAATARRWSPSPATRTPASRPCSTG